MFRQLYDMISIPGRRRVYWVLAAFVLQGVTEVTGVVSVLPFLALAADPDQINTRPQAHQIYLALGFEHPRSFIVFTGVVALATLALGNLTSAITTRSSLSFSCEEQSSASRRLLENYLSRPYAWFLERNMAVLISHVLWEMAAVFNGVLLPSLRIVSRVVVVLLIAIGLLVVNPIVAVTSTMMLGATYSLIYVAMKKRLEEIGRLRILADAIKTRVASEALHGAKISMVLGRESYFLENFSNQAIESSTLQIEQGTSQELPRYLLETLAFGGVICIVLFLIFQGKDVRAVLPILGVFTLAAYRLMPALQQIFSFLTVIRMNIPTLQKMHGEMFSDIGAQRSIEAFAEPLPLEDKIEVKSLEYSYAGTAKPVIRQIDLVIKKNTTVALVGTTGSGKTTLVDLLLGLLTPTGGTIQIDGEPLDQCSLRKWQRNIGYVSQDSYLLDATIGANIAFGLPDSEIDRESIVTAAKIANLHDFVSSLPSGYETVVGDRGVRLSGGQRQRIAIARALYRNPDVLILDEATSALDGITEGAVMDAVQRLANKKTIILIAHRLTTVKSADVIYLLGDGQVLQTGTYEEMLELSPAFRAMAQESPGAN